jgi:hypothetical protein
MMTVYKCNLCNNVMKKIYKQAKDQVGHLVCYCGGVMERQLPDVSTNSIEVVDNGNMARKVELRKDITNKLKERGDKLLELIEKRDDPTEKK